MITDNVRPSDYNELIIKHWNEVVANDDIVYHLGDVIFGDKKLCKSIMEQLKGTKFLIKGNHDEKPDEFYLENGFTGVFDSVILSDGILLSHAPRQLTDDITINIHGHFHGDDHRKQNRFYPFYEQILEDRHYLLAIENTNYYPVLLEEIIRR
jgi:calcineurin-like phosphoesterase family protein